MSSDAAATRRSLLGVVLAGGGSRRFGSPKALASFGGEPLWQRAHRILGEAGMPALVLANDTEVQASIVRSAGVEIRGDLRPGHGPLAGIETGLRSAREAGHAGILVLACDLVLVTPRMLVGLRSAWPAEGAAAFATPGPWGVSPVCSVWALDLLPTVSTALDDGEGSPGRLLGAVPLTRLDPQTVAPDADPARVFRSANTPAELRDLEAIRVKR